MLESERADVRGLRTAAPSPSARGWALMAIPTDPARGSEPTGEASERLRVGWDPALPSGVTTFLMTDIEGSTRLWESRPGAMAEALMRHDEVIADVVAAHGGHLVAAGDGDATTSVFGSATEAVSAAIDVVHALANVAWPEGAPIRVRAGLHTGEVDKRSGNYFGTLPNHAARVRGEARAGEILLSEQTTAHVGGDLPAGFTIVDLGPHTLRGIERPERIRAVAGPGLETTRSAAQCPYRGLLSFGASERDLFFGRERVLAELLERLTPGGLLALVGPSGSGKSSLLCAGVSAAVEAGECPCAHSARLITPGAEPPLDLDGDDSELLVVDQFEELYSLCEDPARRARFIDALLSRRGPVAIGVRADFYGEISDDVGLARAVAANHVLLGPMGEGELRCAIEAPARLAGLDLSPGLVDLVLRDAAGQPGALPLISHALRATWERRDGRTLTVEAYRGTGGVSSAIAQTADTIVAQTPEDQRPLLRAIFLRLAELGDGVEDTRRRVRSDDLVPHGVAPQEVRALLARLADARLVTLDEGTVELAHEVLMRRWPRLRRWLEEDREGIRLYRRLCNAARAWQTAGREPGDLYRGGRLEAALEWSRANGSLLNDTEREFLDSSAEESANALQRRQLANRRLRRSLAAAGGLLVAALVLLAFALFSRHDAVDAEASARSQALATESAAQVTRDPQLALLLARAALANGASPQAELAASEALDANTLRAQLPPLGVQACDNSAYLVLLSAGHTAAADTCQGYVVFADLVHDRITRRVQVGPTTSDMILTRGGRELIVASGRSLVSVDVASGRTRHLYTAPFEIEQLAGPPGHFLAIADRELIALVDLHRNTIHVVARADGSVNGVNGIMSASASTLLVASTGQTQGRGELLPRLTALDVDSGARWTLPLVAPPRIASVIYLRVSADQRTWFVTGSTLNGEGEEQTAATWAIDPRTRSVRWMANGPAGAWASPVQASPDGRLVAVGYSNGEAAVLEAATGHLVARDSSSSTIASGDLAIAADDRTLVTLSLDGLLRTFSTQASERLRMQAPPETSVDFTPSGNDLILLGGRGEIVERGGRVLRSFPGFAAGSVFNYCASCFSATPGFGRLTYLDPNSKAPRVIEIEGRTGRRVAAVTVPRMETQGVTPDGHIAAAYVEGDRMRAELIEPKDGAVTQLAPGATEAGCIAGSPSFTPDGSLMAIGDGCVHVDVWNMRSGRLLRSIVLEEHGSSSAILTPDGRYVLVPIAVGTFARTDLRNGVIEQAPGSEAAGTALAVSPNGRYYAIGREDGSVDEYDARTLRLIRRHELGNAIKTLAFSPSSRELAVEDTSDVVRVWDSCEICENPTQLARRAAAESVRSLTASERSTFDAR
jgi:class 3 adenylate cyclase/WD40 repeat protein